MLVHRLRLLVAIKWAWLLCVVSGGRLATFDRVFTTSKIICWPGSQSFSMPLSSIVHCVISCLMTSQLPCGVVLYSPLTGMCTGCEWLHESGTPDTDTVINRRHYVVETCVLDVDCASDLEDLKCINNQCLVDMDLSYHPGHDLCGCSEYGDTFQDYQGYRVNMEVTDLYHPVMTLGDCKDTCIEHQCPALVYRTSDGQCFLVRPYMNFTFVASITDVFSQRNCAMELDD